jgi:hypothetical protein
VGSSLLATIDWFQDHCQCCCWWGSWPLDMYDGNAPYIWNLAILILRCVRRKSETRLSSKLSVRHAKQLSDDSYEYHATNFKNFYSVCRGHSAQPSWGDRRYSSVLLWLSTRTASNLQCGHIRDSLGLNDPWPTTALSIVTPTMLIIWLSDGSFCPSCRKVKQCSIETLMTQPVFIIDNWGNSCFIYNWGW